MKIPRAGRWKAAPKNMIAAIQCSAQSPCLGVKASSGWHAAPDVSCWTLRERRWRPCLFCSRLFPPPAGPPRGRAIRRGGHSALPRLRLGSVCFRSRLFRPADGPPRGRPDRAARVRACLPSVGLQALPYRRSTERSEARPNGRRAKARPRGGPEAQPREQQGAKTNKPERSEARPNGRRAKARARAGPAKGGNSRERKQKTEQSSASATARRPVRARPRRPREAGTPARILASVVRSGVTP